MKNNIISKITCFIGWHSWTWTLNKVSEFETEPVTGEIPDRAICNKCGRNYS